MKKTNRSREEEGRWIREREEVVTDPKLRPSPRSEKKKVKLKRSFPSLRLIISDLSEVTLHITVLFDSVLCIHVVLRVYL